MMLFVLALLRCSGNAVAILKRTKYFFYCAGEMELAGINTHLPPLRIDDDVYTPIKDGYRIMLIDKKKGEIYGAPRNRDFFFKIF